MDIFGIIEWFRRWWFNQSISRNPVIVRRVEELMLEFNYVLERRDRKALERTINKADVLFGNIGNFVEDAASNELKEIRRSLNRILYRMRNENYDVFTDTQKTEATVAEEGGTAVESVESSYKDELENYATTAGSTDSDEAVAEAEADEAGDTKAEI